MTVLELECKNIRKISSLNLIFHRNEDVFKTNFIMMANGTGKTTIIQLIKGLLDGSAITWNAEKVNEFAPSFGIVNSGEFSFTVKFDDKQYKYILTLNYKEGTAKIETVIPSKGRESGRLFPEALKGIFTSEFVTRFVFDGEQAKKSMDSKSNEAEETIRYLYRLDELDSILSMNSKILEDIQNAEGGSKGTDSSISNLKTRKKEIEDITQKLEKNRIELRSKLETYRSQLDEKENSLKEIQGQFKSLSQEKNEILKEYDKNRSEINSSVNELLVLIKSPNLLSKILSSRMMELGKSMQKLKLPKNSSKDFFMELADSTTCVCDRCISETERKAILKNAERYLGGNQQAVLNIIKSHLIESDFDSRVQDAFNSLEQLRLQEINIGTRKTKNEEKLLKAGGDRAERLQSEIDSLKEKRALALYSLNIIELKTMKIKLL